MARRKKKEELIEEKHVIENKNIICDNDENVTSSEIQSTCNNESPIISSYCPDEETTISSYCPDEETTISSYCPDEEAAILPGDDMNISNNIPTCLILCMCCNDEYYQKEFDDIMSTWGSYIINGIFPHIDIWGYTAADDGKFKIDNQKHMIYVPAFDSIEYTFNKTVKCLEILEMCGFKYDWILRTNCSTTINLNMLEKMLETQWLDDDKIYIAEPRLNAFKSAPTRYMPISRGNLLLFPKKIINILNMQCLQIAIDECDYNRYIDKNLFKIDDLAISAIINTYMTINGYSITDMYKVLPIQYMEDIYKDFNLNAYTFAIFNKAVYELRNIRNYYYDMHDRYMDFYKNFYTALNDDISAMSMQMDNLKYFIFETYDNDKSNIYHIPFDDYMNKEMIELLGR